MNQESGKSGWRRPGRWIAWVPLLLIVVALVLYATTAHLAASRQVEAVRKRNLPTSALDLDLWYRQVPAAENAALVLLEASHDHVLPLNKKDPSEAKVDLVPGEPMPPDLAALVAEYVEKNGAALEKIEEASEMSGSRYPIDLSRGVATLLPHLAPVKRLAQLAKWAAIHESAQGHPDEAVRILHSGFALPASLESEPILISELVRIACTAILLPALERVVGEHALSEDQLKILAADLERAEQAGRTGLSRAITGERAIGIPLFHVSYREYVQLDGMSGSSSGGYDSLELLKAGLYGLRRVLGLQDRDQLFYMRTMESLENATGLEYAQMLPEMQRVAGEVDQQLAQHRLKYAVSGMLLPSLTGAAKKEAITAARLRCARMALAIERFRAGHNGALPRGDELVPEFLPAAPRDPVDESPIEYRARQKGYEVFAPASTALANEGKKPKNNENISFTVTR